METCTEMSIIVLPEIPTDLDRSQDVTARLTLGTA